MTSLLAAPRQRRADRPVPPASEILRRRQPIWLVGLISGLVAAGSTLLASMGVGVIGWFMSDGGIHGSPGDAMRTGALAWLMGHGSGITVQGTPIGAIPLGVSVLAAWVIWRTGVRAGVGVSGHGPDADTLADGARDLVVPLTTGLFVVGYAIVVDLTMRFADAPARGANPTRALIWVVLAGGLIGGAAIATGSGRAAAWLSRMPTLARGSLATARRMLTWWLGFSALVLAISLLADFSTAANLVSQMHTDTSATISYVALMGLIVPNAVLLSSAFLIGPGFMVGSGTVVTPTLVSTGALPTVPLLAALPSTAPGWGGFAWLLAPLVAAAAVASTQRRLPVLDWYAGVMRGVIGGVLAGVGLGVLTGLAGGAVGPGAMQEVGAHAGAVLTHAVASFGIAGGLAGAAMTWWQRRSPDLAEFLPETD